MRTLKVYPNEIRAIENVFIPMRDGVRLAARIWLPVGAEFQPVPALLEYLPYRKRDLTRARDAVNHPYLAGHGYASVRVDLRGSGDSDGVLTDEYTRDEREDGDEVIAWLAEQDWCDGNVGMFGISWGGFNSLQIAARRPPALKAIVSASATENLYVDNMHYMGGCLLGDNLSEATVMFAFNSLPPDPAIVGERWREMWRKRLEGSGLWLETWLEHQHRDAYWREASVCEDYTAITCPVLAVGGWADGYTNAIFRLMEHLEVPRKALIGPWGHRYPHLGIPGPSIGFLQEMVRWWDHWLKGIDTGMMDEPMIRAWMQDSVPPDTAYQDRPGRWVGEVAWPPPDRADVRFALTPHDLVMLSTDQPAPPPLTSSELWIQSPLSVGMFAGKWASYAAVPDLPSDQREEDGGALVFESATLRQPLEVFGLPSVTLDVASDAPVGMLAVRLSDVAPNGEATRVTYGLLNLAHRDGSDAPAPLEPHRRYRVEVALNGIAQRFPAGHRLRLSISSSYWPLAWPSPVPVTLRIDTSGSELRLPVRVPTPQDLRLPELEEAEGAAGLETVRLEAGEHHWRVTRDLAEHETVLEIVNDQGAFRIEETGTVVRRASTEWYTSRGNDVTSVRGETVTEQRLERAGWRVAVNTRTILSCTATHFLLNAQLDAYELDDTRGDTRIHAESWSRAIPRDLV